MVSAQAALHYGALALLGPAWYCAGKLAQRLRLPLITGYVIGGIICGPSGLHLLKDEAQHHLQALDHACLSIIALTAGAELRFADLKRIQRQVVAITLGVSICTWVFVFTAMMLLAAYIPFFATIMERQVASISSLAAMLMVARSPASAIAVLKETGGKGPYCTLIMGVVVMKDVLVFICFAINVEFARMMEMTKDQGTMSLMRVVQPFVSLGSSLLLGTLAGVMLSAYVQWRPSTWRPLAPLARRIPPAITNRLKTLIVAALAICIFWLADGMAAEPLLACVMAGIVTANRRVSESSKLAHDEVADHTARLMTAVNTTFFGLAGASLKLDALMATIWVGVIVWVVRLAAVYCGSWIGAWLGGTPPDLRRKVWQGMITQAGVAMGLARTVSRRFPTWGPDFSTLMVAIILLNLFAGPPLFRGAVISTGEARALQPAQGDIEMSGSPRKSDTPRSAVVKEDINGLSKAEKGLSMSRGQVTTAARSTPSGAVGL